MKNIRKKELITQVLYELAKESQECLPTPNMLSCIIETLFCKIAEDVGRGRDVTLRDVCAFTFVVKGARNIKVPGKKSKIFKLPSQIAIKFKPGRKMKTKLQGMDIKEAMKILKSKEKKRNA